VLGEINAADERTGRGGGRLTPALSPLTAASQREVSFVWGALGYPQ
jgi:hypothetical protein